MTQSYVLPPKLSKRDAPPGFKRKGQAKGHEQPIVKRSNPTVAQAMFPRLPSIHDRPKGKR
jgi:hypothetical protein